MVFVSRAQALALGYELAKDAGVLDAFPPSAKPPKPPGRIERWCHGCRGFLNEVEFDAPDRARFLCRKHAHLDVKIPAGTGL